MNRNASSLAGMILGAPKTQMINGSLTYTTFDLCTHGSHELRSGTRVCWHEVHHIVCVGSLDAFAPELRMGTEVEVEGELRSRRHTTYIGDPAEIQIIYWRHEVVATSIKPFMSYAAAAQESNVDEVMIALYRPDY
jgi:hypothetical protein